MSHYCKCFHEMSYIPYDMYIQLNKLYLKQPTRVQKTFSTVRHIPIHCTVILRTWDQCVRSFPLKPCSWICRLWMFYVGFCYREYDVSSTASGMCILKPLASNLLPQDDMEADTTHFILGSIILANHISSDAILNPGSWYVIS